METFGRFIDSIKAGNKQAVNQMLSEDPRLAGSRTEDGISAILLAQYYGHSDIVQALIDTGLKVDIYEAAATGDLEQVKSLLNDDSTLVNGYSEDGFPVLGLAAFFGHKDIVRNLLSAGADVNAQAHNDMKVRSIHAAAAFRDKDVGCEIARLLLENGANANEQQNGGWTPLHEAANSGSEKLVELLLLHKADPNRANDEGITPVQMAEDKKYPSIVKLLVGTPDKSQ